MARTLLHVLLGVVAFVCGCELLFQALPVSTATQTGYYFDPAILSYPPHHAWTMSTGWDLRNPQRLQSNNFGYLSEHEFVRDENAVALIGDSFVEANMLPSNERPGAQLERYLDGHRPVYAMGSPGTALLDYAERIRFASETFGIRDFVVLMERWDVRQSLCGSGNIHASCLDPVTLAPRTELHPAPSGAKRLLRHSALAQYVFGQLKVSPEVLWRKAAQAETPAQPPKRRPEGEAGTGKEHDRLDTALVAVDAVGHAFFDRVRPYATGRLVIIIDGDRTGSSERNPERERFIRLARSAGAVVVDPESMFARHTATSELSLSVSPTDSHLNSLGVEIVMTGAAAALSGI